MPKILNALTAEVTAREMEAKQRWDEAEEHSVTVLNAYVMADPDNRSSQENEVRLATQALNQAREAMLAARDRYCRYTIGEIERATAASKEIAA